MATGKDRNAQAFRMFADFASQKMRGDSQFPQRTSAMIAAISYQTT
jgi:hypothetical protein